MAPPPPVALFPPPPKITLVSNKELDDAVKTAVGNVVRATPGTPAAPFGITIVNPANYAMGGFNDDKEFYVASLVKMGVMYAAFALRDMVRRYADLRMPASQKALFAGLRAEMDGSRRKGYGSAVISNTGRK